jgi:hypothetical protein
MATMAALKGLAQAAFQNRIPVPPHWGQWNPSGQRADSSAVAHCSSVPKRCRKSGRDNPFSNCTRFISMEHLTVIRISELYQVELLYESTN